MIIHRRHKNRAGRVISLLMAVVMTMGIIDSIAYAPAEAQADQGAITLKADSTSDYVPTQIVNGNFSTRPWMTYTVYDKSGKGTKITKFEDLTSSVMGYGATSATSTSKSETKVIEKGKIFYDMDIEVNTTGKGWNTTDIATQYGDLFEWTDGKKNGTPNGQNWAYNTNLYYEDESTPSKWNFFAELNAANPATLYQDLATYPGDVIQWTLKHGLRTESSSPANQAMEVQIGAPVMDGNKIVYPKGISNNITLNITPDSLATYYYDTSTKKAKVTGTYGAGNETDLAKLLVTSSVADDKKSWQPVKGVYTVPEGQDVTRFAFISRSTDKADMGNLLDDITFSTLFGNLTAKADTDGTVTVWGYWGDSQDKHLVVEIDQNGDEVIDNDEKTSILMNVSGNFEMSIPKSMVGNATMINIYHEDYRLEGAMKKIPIWRVEADEENPDKLSVVCEGEVRASIELKAPNSEYTGTPYIGAYIEGIETWEEAGYSTPIIYYEALESPYSGKSSTAPSEAGSYRASIEVEGQTAYIDFTITKKALTLTASGRERPYDGTTQVEVIGSIASGLCSEDAGQVSVVSAAGTVDSATAGSGKLVTVGNLTIAGEKSRNYTVIQPSEVRVNITKKPVTAVVTAQSKQMDGTTTAVVSAEVPDSKIIAGDSITITGLTGTFSDALPGTDKTVTVNTTGMTISGTNSSSYEVTVPTTALASILKDTPAGSISVANFTYGTTVPVPAASGTPEGVAASIVYYVKMPDGSEKPWTELTPTTLEPGTYQLIGKFPGNSQYEATTFGPVSFNVNSADMNGVGADNVNVTYDGLPHTILVTGAPDGATIRYGESESDCTHPTISFTDATEGQKEIFYSVSKTGYTTVKSSAFLTINPRSLQSPTVTATAISAEFVFDTTDKSPELTVDDSEIDTLVRDTDYSLSGDVSAGAVGEYVINITGQGNYTGTLAFAWRIKDASAPSGRITIGSDSWTQQRDEVITHNPVNTVIPVTFNASEGAGESGIGMMGYFCTEAIDYVLTADELEGMSDALWMELVPDDDGNAVVSVDTDRTFVYYLKAVDRAGNAVYVTSDRYEVDMTAPVIDGVRSDTEYKDGPVTITVTDKNLDTVTVNAEPVTLTNRTYKLPVSSTPYEIICTDKAGNTTTVTGVKVKNPAPSPSPSPLLPTGNKLIVRVENENALKVAADINGTVAGVEEITNEILKDVLGNVGESQSESVVIDVSAGGAQLDTIVLTKNTLNNLNKAVKDGSNTAKSVTLILPQAEVVIDARTLQTLCEDCEGDLKLVVKNRQIMNLNSSQRKELEKKEVVKLFEAYFESNGKRIHDFRYGEVELHVNYDSARKYDENHFFMEYIPESGSAERYKSWMNKSKLCFVTTHFSDYAVVYDSEEENATEEMRLYYEALLNKKIEENEDVLSLEISDELTSAALKSPYYFQMSKLIKKGKTFRADVTNVFGDAKVKFTTSNKKIATVSKKGLIRGVRNGTCRVTCSITQNKKEYKFVIRVIVRNKENGQYTLKEDALVTPENSDRPLLNVYKLVGVEKPVKLSVKNLSKKAVVKYTSSDKKIVKVSKDGYITGLKKGFASVTVHVEQKGLESDYRVLVRVSDGTKNEEISKYLDKLD